MDVVAGALRRVRGRGILGRMRGRHLFAADLAGGLVAGYTAIALSTDRLLGPSEIWPYLALLGLLAAVHTATNLKAGLFSRDWRFANATDCAIVVAGAVLGSMYTFLIFAITLGLGAHWPPGLGASFWVAEALLAASVIGGMRFMIRWASEWRPTSMPVARAEVRRTLLYGAGRTGNEMARAAQRDPRAGVLPVGFLDDDPDLGGRRVAGLPVLGGLDALDAAVAQTGATSVIITMPTAPGDAKRKVVDAAMARAIDVRTVPSMYDLLDGTLDAYQIRRVQVEDLLGRPMSTTHAAAVKDLIGGRVVLITGAAGSIGSELARQVHSVGPRRLILLDRAESALYLLQRELDDRHTAGDGPTKLSIRLADVVDRAAMERVMLRERPDVTFHAAAYKHVPMLEDHPSDAVQVNIAGTMSVLDASIAAGVQRFVLVSTDKAVRPTSVMGASKRVAEMLLADAARRTGRAYVAVRFGNVLGSNGSVIPIFQEQLAKGEPLTVTHPDMTRFFMTIPEASWLILDAAALGSTGDLFVLDMGEPVRIMDLARDFIRLAGRDPESQPIRIVGLRPGEKLHEELFYDAEQVEATSVPKVLRALADPPPARIREDAGRLIALATGTSEAALRDALLAYVQGSASGVRPVVTDDAPEAALSPLLAPGS
jgi:FlaA1/EpsC-like NDP-sugar epimerase